MEEIAINVNRGLVEVALRLMAKCKSSREIIVCAAYLGRGTVVTGISHGGVSTVKDAVEEVLSKSRETDELIAALVTLTWSDSNQCTAVCTPLCHNTLIQVQSRARRHAQIAVSGFANDKIVVRPLWELVDDDCLRHSNTALKEGRFGAGMKCISHELASLSTSMGVKHARRDFSDAFVKCLNAKEIREQAKIIAHPGSRFLTPNQLNSISLRHVWLAFEVASEHFVFHLIDSVRFKLIQIGCNDADIVHIKQGLEALRNIFAVLLVFIETRRRIPNECPFFPYDCHLLENGIPIHEYLQFGSLTADAASSPATRNFKLLEQLQFILSRSDEGGFLRYLRQRGLYVVDLFKGGGAGHCPFSSMSDEILMATSTGLERALNEDAIMIAAEQ